MTLVRVYQRAVPTGEKHIDFSLCIVALYVKGFGPSPNHLEISDCMCESLCYAKLLQFFIF